MLLFVPAPQLGTSWLLQFVYKTWEQAMQRGIAILVEDFF